MKLFLLLATSVLLFFAPLGALTAEVQSLALDQVVQQKSQSHFIEADEFGRYRYLVDFSSAGALQRFRGAHGTSAGFRLTDPLTSSLLEAVRSDQDVFLADAGRVLERGLDPSHRFLVSRNGVALRLTPGEAMELSRMPGVVAVERERVYELDTYRGPEFIGADAIWDGSAVPNQTGLEGEGMVVAILDSGVIDPAEHDSFANDPACGHGETPTPDKLISALDCSSATGPGGLCNGPFPFDYNGHGAHVAGTAAGNRLTQGSASPALDVPGSFDSITGVAPCAHIRSYKVCPGRSCPGADIFAGLESVLLHADVDVANYSISGGGNPWNDFDSIKLELVDSDVFVAASAGNSGPDPSTVGHRGPWVMTVAASTRDVDSSGDPAPGDVLAGFSSRGPTPAPFGNIQKPDITAPGVVIFAADVFFLLSASGPGTPPAETQNIFLRPGTRTLVRTVPFDGRTMRHDESQDPDAEGCNGFPSGFFDDAVALVRRGGCPEVDKINHAFDAGADFVVVFNSESGPFTMDTFGQEPKIEAFSASQQAGQALLDFIGDSSGEIEVDYIVPPDFWFKSGTSMSSPHVAGAATLVRQAQPNWSVMEVHSAIRMTAVRQGFKQDGATPWDWDDVGSGRVDLTRAALAGLVMNESRANFDAADPDEDGDVRTLNLPALRDMDCDPDCTFTRVVRNTLDQASNWEVEGIGYGDTFSVSASPSQFNFNGGLGETQVVEITITPDSENSTGQIDFGEVVFTETGGLSPDLHWTVAIIGLDPPDPPAASISPLSFEFTLDQGADDDDVLTIANTGGLNLTYSIERAEVFTVELVGESPQSSVDEGESEPIELIIDTGLASNTGVGEQQWLWFNRFSPGLLELPFSLEEVQVGWAPGNGNVEQGDEYDVYVWSAPDGDPLGNIELLAVITGLTVGSSVGFESVMLPEPPDITAEHGDVLIGVVNRSTREDYFPAIRDASASQQRSWLAFNFTDGAAGDPPDLSDAGFVGLIEDANPALAANWTIRGFRTGGSACLAPSDVAWLSVSEDEGVVAPDQADEITVMVDADELDPGTYDGRLCIETNDPAQPKVVVTVTLEVESDPDDDPVFHDRFEAAESQD